MFYNVTSVGDNTPDQVCDLQSLNSSQQRLNMSEVQREMKWLELTK